MVQFCCATYLDHFLTQPWTSFLAPQCCSLGAETTIYSAFSKNANFKDTPKTLFLSPPVLIALVKMSVFLFLHFIFGVFGISNVLSEVLLIGSQNRKITEKNKAPKTKNKRKLKNNLQLMSKSSLVFQNKRKQQAETTKQHLQTETNITKTKSEIPNDTCKTKIEPTLNQKTLELLGKQWFSEETKRNKHKEIKNTKKGNPKITKQ